MASLESSDASNPMADSYEYKHSKMIELLEGAETMLPIKFGPNADGTIQITNLPAIEEYIAQQADEELQQTLVGILKDIQSEMEILNGIRPSPYDVILYLNLHGVFKPDYVLAQDECLDDGLSLCSSGRIKKGAYSVTELDWENKNVTLLTSTCMGVKHILHPAFLSGKVKKFIDDQYDETRMLDVKKLQSSLRSLKQKYIREHDPTPDIESKRYTRESWVNFTHDIGWGISKNKWLNKILQKDMETFKWPIQIIRDEKRKISMSIYDDIILNEGKSHMDLKGQNAPYITLTKLIYYLLALGYSNILIIDSSCGAETLYKGRYIRRLARWQKKAGLFDGGKTKRNKKTKRTNRKNKRTKRK